MSKEVDTNMADNNNIGGEVAENEEYLRTMKWAKVEDDESKRRRYRYGR